MAFDVDVQVATRSRSIPSVRELSNWATLAMRKFRSEAEVTLRLVDRAEGTELNEHYRGRLGKTGPTNVLSFPFDPPPGLPGDSPAKRLLGDVIICAPVVTQEAQLQGKIRAEHWAHMVVHGVLHLLGYDHRNEHEALEMEAIERELLES